MIKVLIVAIISIAGFLYYIAGNGDKENIEEIYPLNLAEKYVFETRQIDGKEISVSVADDDKFFNGDVTQLSDRTIPIVHEIKTEPIPDDYNVDEANPEAFRLMTNFKSTVADLIVGDKILIDVQENKTLELNIDELGKKIGGKVIKSADSNNIGNSTIVAGNVMITGSIFTNGTFYRVSSIENGNSVITNMDLSGVDYLPPEGAFDDNHPPLPSN